MSTDAMTLSEYAELVGNLAESWDDDDEPIILIGDRNGNVGVSADDGFTKHGCVGFAQELFGGNGVMELGQQADTRFYGTMLFHPDDLDEEVVERIYETDYRTEVDE